MSTARMTRRLADASPRVKARLAGACYLLGALTSVFGQFLVLGRLEVSGDAAATAANILGHEPLFWLGFSSALLSVAFHLAWAALFYDVFTPVDRSVALLAAFVMIVGCALLAVASLFQAAAVLVLGGGTSLSAFTGEQVQALALLLLNLNGQTYNIFLVFFGLWLLLIGYLIVRSTFLPRLIGVLVAFAGVGYLTLLSPPLADALYPFYLAPTALGEPALLLWLLLVGVNAQRWKEQAGAAGAPLRT